MTYEEIGKWLRMFFTNYLYPTLIIIIMFYLFGLLIYLIIKGKGSSSYIRRSTGALLPIVMLVFGMAISGDSIKMIENVLLTLPNILQLLLGAIIGTALIEFGRYYLKTDIDGAASLLALFVSSIFSFILWCVMGGVLNSLNYSLVGLILFGGLDIIFRGQVRK
ncbi:MAG: hypothetical protein FD122_2361 [Stygiobacter sp.]|nr:MAG: hypothetical protein FD122_2361 [Stygiobacter sp.]KAF0211401.1 MAG: hypothetical protein FD178_3438 [Ignavibacteria bacterium]